MDETDRNEPRQGSWWDSPAAVVITRPCLVGLVAVGLVAVVVRFWGDRFSFIEAAAFGLGGAVLAILWAMAGGYRAAVGREKAASAIAAGATAFLVYTAVFCCGINVAARP